MSRSPFAHASCSRRAPERMESDEEEDEDEDEHGEAAPWLHIR